MSVMIRSAVRIACILIALLLVVAVAGILWHTRPQRTGWFTDGDEIKSDAALITPRDVLWLPPEAMDERFNTAKDEYEPRLAAEGAMIFFVRGRAGENADIYFSTRTVDGWSEPAPLDAINTEHEELGPEPSPDGRSLYFYSDRPGGEGGYDLWVAQYRDGAWQEPVNLGTQVNTSCNEYGPALDPEGDLLYFSSNRPRPEDMEEPDPDAWPATVREDLYQRDYDIYASTISDRGVGPARPIAELNTRFNDGAPAVSPVGDFLYFTSDRPGGEGGFDVYRCRRLDGACLEVENIGPEVNTKANEMDPGLALRGFRLYFSSDRPVAAGETEAQNGYDLYWTTSREVFLETQTYRASIDWRELVAYLPWALLALLLLLLLLLLRQLALSPRYGALNLLTRCLLASAAVHVLLMILLGFWGVGTSLSNWIRDGGGTQVALVSTSAVDDLAAQLRGGLTDHRFEPAVESSEQWEVAPAASEAETPEAQLPVDRAETEPEERTEWTAAADDAPPTPPSAPSSNDELNDEETPVELLLPEQAVPTAEAEAIADPRAAVNEGIASARAVELPSSNMVDATAIEERLQPVRVVDDAAAASLVREVPQEAESSLVPDHRRASAIEMEELPSPIGPALPPVPESPRRQADEAERTLDGLPAQSSRLTTATGIQPMPEPAMRLDPSATESVPEVSVAVMGEAAADTSGTQLTPVTLPSAEPVILDRPQTIALELRSVPEGGGEQSVEGELVVVASAEHAARSENEISVQSGGPVQSIIATPSNPVEAAIEDSPLADWRPTDLAEAGGVAANATEPAAFTLDSLDELSLPPAAGNAPQEDAEESIVVRATSGQPGTRVREVVSRPEPLSPGSVAVNPLDPVQQAEATAAPLPNAAAVESDAVEVPIARPSAAGLSVPELTIDVPPLNETGEPVAVSEAVLRQPVDVPELRQASSESAPSVRRIGTIEMDPIQSESERQAHPEDPDCMIEPAEAMDETPAPRRVVDLPEEPAEGLALLPIELEVATPVLTGPPLDIDENAARMGGLIRGMVTNARTGEPLPGATVRLDLPDGDPITATTNEQGGYAMATPEVPEFMAISASLDGFTPQSLGISAEELQRRVVERDFELMPRTPDLIVIEADPEVHHLGDNQFTGRINSQFQKRSEGRRFRASFEIPQGLTFDRDEEVLIMLFARGTQRDNQIRINSRRVSDGLNHAPRDGSFGEFEATFPGSWLKEGRNTIEIRSVYSDSTRSDLDDFEFVNIRLYLPGHTATPALPQPEYRDR
ncbi:MAG: PD40 domain-containing protein [Phycisphaerales bacterium]|nr:MAG: PD40 domain-containing protein [Phycisphaerales bacterium]